MRLPALIASFLIAHNALATIIPGGNIINQTWTPAGSPYIVQGDITIPAGAFLTIQPGVDVQFASTDSQAAGLDTARVELTVRGTLTANGTAAAPITFAAQNPGVGVWYGIVADTSATSCVVSNATIRHAYAGLYGRATGPGQVLQATSVSISSCMHGVILNAGAPLLDRLTINAFQNYGVIASGTAVLNLTNSFVYNSGAATGVNSSTIGTACSLTHCTISNCAFNVAHLQTGTLSLYNCIVSQSTGYGVFQNGGAGAILIDHCDVWNNVTNYGGCAPGPGCISVNPMVASATDAHLTATSLCIDAGDAAHTSAVDLYGIARPQNGDGIGGAAPDIGAAEFVCTAPSISQHPAPVTTTVGHQAVFTVNSSGSGLTYQWRRNSVNLVNQGGISGVTTATLTIAACSAGDAGSYDVLVTGCGSAISNAATLAVNPAPTCGSADFNGDGDLGTDADIEAFFRVLAGGSC